MLLLSGQPVAGFGQMWKIPLSDCNVSSFIFYSSPFTLSMGTSKNHLTVFFLSADQLAVESNKVFVFSPSIYGYMGLFLPQNKFLHLLVWTS